LDGKPYHFEILAKKAQGQMDELEEDLEAEKSSIDQFYSLYGKEPARPVNR